MITDYILYMLLWLVMLANFAGYVIWLAFMRVGRPALAPPSTDPEPFDPPSLSVIVAVYNEAGMIADKLEDLLRQDYPRDRLRIVVVDGGSSDGTAAAARAFAEQRPDAAIDVLTPGVSGKINQMNAALAHIGGGAGVIVNTDADARIIAPDALRRAARRLTAPEEPPAGVVGGWTSPATGGRLLNAEHAYWDKANRMRYMETVSGSSSIVVAPFYAFRPSLLRRFPDDCVADDVHIAMQAHDQGLRVIYAPDIQVIELRQPQTIKELFRHKFRKAHAYMMEILRFSHRLPFFAPHAKTLLLIKLMQFIILPWVTVAYGLLTLKLLYDESFVPLLVCNGLLAAGALTASCLMTPPPGMRRGGVSLENLASSLTIFAIVNFTLIANAVLFPFWRQSAQYRRVEPAPTPARHSGG
jgi:poly-beta-1,6-N-acetyl-D-glucosamine synthase